MAVPRQLATRVPRSEIKVSLQTSDPLAARVRSRLLSNAFDVLFAELERMPQITTAMIDERIRDYFQGCLNRSLEHTQLLPTDPFNDMEREVASLHDSLEQMRRQLAAQTFSPSVVQHAKAMLQQSSSGNGPIDPEALQYTCTAVLRANIENARILAAKLSGRYDETAPKDPLFADMSATGLPPIRGEAAPVDPKAVTLKAVGELFLAFKAKHDFAAKTTADVKRVLALAYEVIGAGKAARQVDTEDIKALRDLIATLPPNYMKAPDSAGVTAKQASAANCTGKALSLQTQEKYLRMFKSVLAWGADEGHLDKPPGVKVKVAGVAKLKSLDQRLPYSADQLKAIFTSPLYTGHKSPTLRARPGTLVIRDGKFWTPLIALYSGMRMGEIVQLLTADLKQAEGIWYFDVTKTEGDDKKLKTKSSWRRVPVHPVLVDAGLLEVAKNAKPKGRLFPDIEQGQDGYYSHNFSKWWGRYAKQVGFYTPKTAFHSFRHNFKDALQAASVAEYVAKALMGHADNSVHAQYGSGPSLLVLKAGIDKVQFPIELGKVVT